MVSRRRIHCSGLPGVGWCLAGKPAVIDMSDASGLVLLLKMIGVTAACVVLIAGWMMSKGDE